MQGAVPAGRRGQRRVHGLGVVGAVPLPEGARVWVAMVWPAHRTVNCAEPTGWWISTVCPSARVGTE